LLRDLITEFSKVFYFGMDDQNSLLNEITIVQKSGLDVAIEKENIIIYFPPFRCLGSYLILFFCGILFLSIAPFTHQVLKFIFRQFGASWLVGWILPSELLIFSLIGLLIIIAALREVFLSRKLILSSKELILHSHFLNIQCAKKIFYREIKEIKFEANLSTGKKKFYDLVIHLDPQRTNQESEPPEYVTNREFWEKKRHRFLFAIHILESQKEPLKNLIESKILQSN
jgi:hypothetical protein